MRILQLAEAFPPSVGGEQRHVANVTSALAARGHDVTVATLTPGATHPDAEVVVLRGAAQRVPGLNRATEPHCPPVADPLLTAALRRLVGERRIDVVHAHSWIAGSYVPVRRAGGPPVVVTLHDSSHVCPTKRLMRGGRVCPGPSPARCLRCSQRFYGGARGAATAVGTRVAVRRGEPVVDAWVPVSRSVAVTSGLRHTCGIVEVIPNVVPVTALNEPFDPSLPDRLPQGPFVLYAGEVRHDKGVGVLMEALAGLAGPPPLVAIGPVTDGTRPVGGACFTGRLDHGSVMEALRRCTVAVVPSLVPDACPTTVLEAMLAGAAVVGTNHGGTPDLLTDGVTGRLVPPGDVAALRTTLAALLANADERHRLGAHARVAVGAFTLDAVTDRLEELYARVLTGAVRRTGGRTPVRTR